MKTEYKFTTEEMKLIILAGMSVMHPTLQLGKEPKVRTYDTYGLGMAIVPDVGEVESFQDRVDVRKKFWQVL